jgi:DNA-binding transcriptional ArsR family regulator
MVKHLHPVARKETALDTTFLALADPTRRAILAVLHTGDATVSDLARPHKMSMPAVMKHIGVLERAGLVTHHKTGRTRRCHLVAAPMAAATHWLETYRKFWENNLDSLEQFLANEQFLHNSQLKSHPQE